MRKFGEILAAIGRALRSGVRLAGEMSVEAIEGIARMVAGMLRRRQNETEEHVDVADNASDTLVDAVGHAVDKVVEEDRKASAKVVEARGTVGERMQYACRLIERDQPIGRPFRDLANENALVVYLSSLTPENRAAILDHHHTQITRLLQDANYSLRGVPSFKRRAEREKAPSTTIDEALNTRTLKVG